MSVTHDFGDGRGEVPAHRHANPDGGEGGWVADSATVDAAIEIPRTASVGSGASVGPHASMGVLRASIRIPVDGGTVPIIFDSPHDAKVWAARALAALDTAWNESWGADELVSAS